MTLDPDTPLGGAALPLALLPVRVETRFFAQSDGSGELRVRIYPDKIHLDSHEPALTAGERDWAQHYWQACWQAGRPGHADAWRQLAERFGAPRAAWLARQLTPINLDARPAEPVPAGVAAQPAAVFPNVALAPDGDTSTWRQAPQARLLPDRWLALASIGGSVVASAAGRAITGPVAVGPDPRSKAPEPATDAALPVEPGMAWMLDFDTAEQLGMALRLPLTPAQMASGVDTLLVLGVRAGLSGDESARQLADLLDAHQHTDGLAFLAPGAPTNNSSEARSAYSSADDGPGSALPALPAPPAADSNAGRTGIALGLPAQRWPATLGRIARAAECAERDARAMNTALWPATGGYFLHNLVGHQGTGLTAAHVDWARAHFVDHVRWGGALPALRIGRQPYGLLAVTSLDLWQPAAGDGAGAARERWLCDHLRQWREGPWRSAAARVPFVGASASPADDLARVMRTDAVSSGYAVRPMMGRHFVDHLRSFLREDLAASGWAAEHQAQASARVQRLDAAWQPRLLHMVFGDTAWPLALPLVGEADAATAGIAALLAAATVADLLQQPAGNLLDKLLRHATLLEIAQAAARLLASPERPREMLLRDDELIDLVAGAAPSLTWQRQLDSALPGGPAGRTVRAQIEATWAAPADPALRAFRDSLAHLQGLDAAALQLGMQGTLDLTSHRLDAWISSFANQRLAALRAVQPQGLLVGGYGWVQNLKPAPMPLWATDATGPLYAPPADPGFVHAPSLTQAATAALLRNAHLGHAVAPGEPQPLAIDLSSHRVRLAEELIDGVRQGQSLGALLGYRFERRLHEAGAAAMIAPVRRSVRSKAGHGEPAPLPEQGQPDGVVDGLRLWALRRGGRLDWLGGHPTVLAAIDEIGDAVDALSDALTAESAYQLVRGNTARIAGTLNAITRADAALPELELVRTPRSGSAVTQRMLLLFSGRPVTTVGWATPNRSLRASAEPMLNAWAARLIGDPRQIRCVVERLDDAGTVLSQIELPLAELEITPLDMVFSVDLAPRPSSATALEQRVLYQARRRSGGFTLQDRLRIGAARPAAGGLSLQDAITQARHVRRLLAGARALAAPDLDLPERGTTGTLDLAGLQARVVAAEDALRALDTRIDALQRRGNQADSESLRLALLACDGIGLPGAIPALALGDDAATRQALLAQLALLRRAVQARIAQAAALRVPLADDPGDSTQAWRRQLADRLQAVFGPGFVAMPGFICGHAAELANALRDSTAVQGGDALAAATWFTRASRTREGLARLGAALHGAEVLGTGERLRLSVLQLPHAAGARWAGLPAAPGGGVPAGRLSLVVQCPASLAVNQVLSGLLIDEWIEVVPQASETTAITFQAEPPDACAPQAVLLAVPPVPGRGWTVGSLHQVLRETLDLARLRTVDLHALDALGHLLPAVGLALNTSDDAVSTDLAAQAG